jgi:hypothetical protein
MCARDRLGDTRARTDGAQVKATVAAVKRILAECRELQAYAANL